MSALKAALAALVLCVALPIARAARADDLVHQCVSAHAEGQQLQHQGKLLAAKARFVECRAEGCPALVREDCVAFERAVSEKLPSVVFVALDDAGRSTSEPVVLVDAATTPLAIDGRPVPLEPGPHRFRFQRRDGSAREVHATLVEAEQRRQIWADFRPPLADSYGDADVGARAAVLVSGSIAAVALGGFTYFALSGRAIQSDLERCRPNCTDRDEFDRMNTRYTLADISLGLAVVSLGVGGYVWWKHPKAFARSGAQPAPRVAVGVSPSGVWARGEF